MKLESQVVSLELAKRLKELGVKQDSFAYWYKPHTAWQLRIDRTDLGDDWADNQIVSAFTVGELGEMLPDNFRSMKLGKGWFCRLYLGPTLSSGDGVTGETEADARGKMLIYLIENGLIKTEGEKQK